jgi:MraZ protein
MFLGSYNYTVDAKGRVAIPAKLRKYVSPEANNTFILTRGAGKYIDLYPMDYWKELTSEKLNSLNTFNPKDMLFLRMFLEHAIEENLDGQSRLLLPKSLIEHAGIEKDVLILGAVKKIEIWNPAVYEAYIADSSASYEEIAAEVMKM